MLLRKKFSENFVFGINYIPSYVCSNFWEDFRKSHIEKDFNAIKSCGFDIVRFPVHWAFAEPSPGKLNPVFESNLKIFLSLSKKYKIKLLPWFLVGVATETYDVPYLEGESLYSERSTRLASGHLKQMVSLMKSHRFIWGWDIADEPYGMEIKRGNFTCPSPAITNVWINKLSASIRSEDASRPVIFSDHFNIPRSNCGFYPERYGKYLDAITVGVNPNFWNESVTGLRNNLVVPFHIHFRKMGKPVIATEAPMCSGELAGHFQRAGYYRNTILLCIVEGAKGAMPWVWSDFAEEAYEKKPAWDAKETCFGIVDKDGREKPAAGEIKKVISFFKKNNQGENLLLKIPSSKAAIMVPERFYDNLPKKTGNQYTGLIEANPNSKSAHTLLNSYALLKMANIPCDFLHPWQGTLHKYAIIFIPDCESLSVKRAKELKQYVAKGGVICMSYAGIEGAFIRELFSYERIRNKSITNLLSWNSVRTNFLPDFECMKSMNLPVAGSFKQIVIRPVKSHVLVRDEKGYPLVIGNSYGKGKAIFLTFPLERMLNNLSEDLFEELPFYQFFSELAKEAGLVPEMINGSPVVSTALLRSSKDRETRFLF